MSKPRHYHVIVIGAGNAGLTCAALLAKHGLRVLVLERNLVPGGCATSFVRGRFEFEVSLHEIGGVGYSEHEGSVRSLFEELGCPVDWVMEKNLYRTIAEGPDGYDLTMPTGIEAYCQKIEEAVPGSLESVRRVFEYGSMLQNLLDDLSSGAITLQSLQEHALDALRMASHSVDDCLNALGVPEKAGQILKTYWPYLGASTDQMDFAHYMMMFMSYIESAPAMPSRKSHELSMALEKAILENGGEIRYHSEVTGLIVRHHRVCGVRVNGKAIRADYVAANCFPEVGLRMLQPNTEIPLKSAKLINARSYGKSFFTVYLGLNRSAEELGIRDYSVFLYNTPDSREQHDTARDPGQSFVIVNCLNTVIPASSPQGTCTLFFSTFTDEEIWENLDVRDYKKTKNQIAERLIRRYEEKLGIEIRPYIEEIAVSAPPTFARYLNTPNGTPYGYEVQPWDSLVVRIINAHQERLLPHLFFAGAHGDHALGYITTYASGRNTAERILKEVKKHEQEA